MLRFAANLTLLFTERPFSERFAAAATAGFTAVECQFPYNEVSAAELTALLHENGLTLVLFNLPAGNWEAGDRGIACDPARIDEFRAGVETALPYVRASGCTRLNCLPGLLPKGVTREQAQAVLIDNLRYAAAKLATVGATLLMEPINCFDIPDFLVNTSVQGQALITRAAVTNLQLQYDLYHMYRMGEDITQRLALLGDMVGHIQFADSPGRHQPGTGDMPLAKLFDAIAASTYSGWVSAEYHPAGTTESSLGWFSRPHVSPKLGGLT